MSDGRSQAPFRNWISGVGALLTTIAAVLFIVFFVLDLAGLHTNPYYGIVIFLLLPAVFVLGLLLIPLGAWRERRRVAAGGAPSVWPTVDLASATARRTAIVILVLTGVNVIIVSLAAYKSIEYSDSTGFCTGVCHTPMEPQAVAHQRGVHASISCASCHVGPGPQGFVRAKLGGVRRLAGVVTGNYARPIVIRREDLPAAAGTCVTCHAADRFIGDRTRTTETYPDERGAPEVSTIVLNVGGGGFERGGPHGIHWHASPRVRVEYVAADERGETISWVRVTDAAGSREYVAEGVTPEQIARGPRRVMDCADCHNRIGHRFAPSVERAVDDALSRGLLPPLPSIRREAAAAAGAEYPSAEAATEAIAQQISSFYASQPLGSDAPRVNQAIAATQRIYLENVFPEMRVTWGSYPSNIGHTDAPGCFRCHDEQHTSPDGRVITQDCETCHRFP